MSSSELLPCPFCGALPKVDNYGSGACARIYCDGSDCEVYPSARRYSRKSEAYELAIAAWNTRHKEG